MKGQHFLIFSSNICHLRIVGTEKFGWKNAVPDVAGKTHLNEEITPPPPLG
jgi:hypothetical protein